MLNKIYKKSENAPWTFREPNKELIRLVSKKVITPCKVLDVGSWEGYQAIYLASNGFEVIGIDKSKEAIKHAEYNSKKAGVDCKFILFNIKDLDKLRLKFDFIFEWRVLHFILNEEERADYIKNLSRVLNKDGLYISVSFSDKSKSWGSGKVRTPSDTKIPIYMYSQQELTSLFEPYFNILEKKLIKLPEKNGNHILGHYFFMKKI